MKQNVHRVLDPRYRQLLVDEDDAVLEAHRAVMRPGAELIAVLPDGYPYTFTAETNGFSVRYTGPITSLNRESEELGRLGSVMRQLGYEPFVHRGRRETVLYLSRTTETARAA